MRQELHFLTHSSGAKIPYFTEQETVWISATEVAKLLNYAKPQGAIKRHVSAANQKRFNEFTFGVRIPGIQPNRIFINFHGLQELLSQNNSHPLATAWATTASFFESESQGMDRYASAYPTRALQTTELGFSHLSEIPETVSKPLAAHGFLYLLKWNQFGKVGKTRSLRNRKQALLQKFVDSQVIWFCFCENIDLLEQEILQKLEHLGALVKDQESTEIFDPAMISFEAVREEIERLANQINLQWDPKNEKRTVQQDYLKFATVALEPLLPFAKHNPETYIHVLEKVLQGFEKI